MDFIKDIRRVFNANVITLIIGIIIGFALPAFLPIQQYADIKTYTLYVSLIGIFHFGFIDGVFLKYGGKRIESIDNNQLLSEKNFLFSFQCMLALMMIAISVMLKNFIFFAFACSLIPNNMITFYKYVYQALGEFTLYTKITYITSIGNLLIQIIFMLLKIRMSMFYILGTVFINVLVYFLLETFKPFKSSNRINWNYGDYKECFSTGIFVLIGNFSMVIFYSMDRLFVKYFFDEKSFAYYSFAISMMTAINILTNSLTTTFYPYLARVKDSKKFSSIKDFLLITGVFASGSFFVFSFIVINFIKKYTPSLSIISILFAGFPAIVIVNVLYINLYKVKKKQKKYLMIVCTLLVLALCLIVSSFYLFHDYKTIALITTITFYMWLFYSTNDFKGIQFSLKNVSYIFAFFAIYFVTIHFFNLILGFVIYYIAIATITYILYWEKIKNIVISIRAHEDD